MADGMNVCKYGHRNRAADHCSTCAQYGEPLDFAPLLPFYAEQSIKGLPPALHRAFHRAQVSGRVTPYIADELAIAIGRHPVEIWGDAWLVAA